MDILTDKELQELSGYKKATSIIKWLTLNKIAFLVAASGFPKVHKQTLAYKMGVKTNKTDSKITEQKTLPNFSNIL